MTILVFLAGMYVGSCLCMVAYSCGQAWRRGRPVVFTFAGRRWDAGHTRRAYALVFAWMVIFLPFGIVHDTMFPKRPWLGWAGPDEP